MDTGDAMSAQAPTSTQIESGQREPTMDEGLLQREPPSMDEGLLQREPTMDEGLLQREPTMDEGLLAWLQVLGSWILFANTWWVLGWLEPHDGVSHALRTTQSMWTIQEWYLTMISGV